MVKVVKIADEVTTVTQRNGDEIEGIAVVFEEEMASNDALSKAKGVNSLLFNNVRTNTRLMPTESAAQYVIDEELPTLLISRTRHWAPQTKAQREAWATAVKDNDYSKINVVTVNVEGHDVEFYCFYTTRIEETRNDVETPFVPANSKSVKGQAVLAAIDADQQEA